MKYYVMVFLSVMFLAVPVMADTPENSRPKFDPERFEASLEQFITTKAGLTPQEAGRFFPIYREMQSKIRVCFNEMRLLRHTDVNDNVMSEKAIRKIDLIDIEIKKIQHLLDIKQLVCRIISAMELWGKQKLYFHGCCYFNLGSFWY